MKTTTVTLMLLTLGTAAILAAPQAAAFEVNTPDPVKTAGGPCNGLVDDNCVCEDSGIAYCSPGQKCRTYAVRHCIVG